MRKFVVKILICAVVAFMICLLSSCILTESAEGVNDYEIEFGTIDTEWLYKFRVIYDKETKVMYAASIDDGNKGTLTVLLNADGTPRVYEER